MSAIAIDFETANERRDSACAVGLAWIEGARVVRRETRLIRPPDLRFAPGNIRVHGILPADVRDRPGFAEVMAPFLPELAGRLVLAHNASFDMGVLRGSLAAWGRGAPRLSYLCTVRLARRVFPDPAGCGLAKVAGRLGIRFEHHDAGEDAYACAEIALAAVRETGARDVADLPRHLGMPAATLSGGLGPSREAGRSTATRALMTVREPPAPDALRFVLRGSRGDPYAIVLEEGTAPSLRCDCPAGRFRRRCRHVEALVGALETGEVGDLIAGLDDLDRLRARISVAGGAVGPAQRRGPV